MERDPRQEALQKMLSLAASQGYITFDEIMQYSDEYELSLQDFDWITNTITTRGILVYDTPPTQRQEVDEDEDFGDYAQIDYDAIYNEIIQIDPGQVELVNEVRSIIPPQYREVSQLKYLVKEGNEHARQRMIEMHLRHALRLALQRTKQYDMEFADAIDTAVMGLIIAVDRYDPDTSGPFASYASLWILQTMGREQATQNPLMYFPVHRKELYFNIYPTLKRYGCIECPDLSACPKAAQMMVDRTGCTSEQVPDILRMVVPFESLDMYFKNIELCFEDNPCFYKTHRILSYDGEEQLIEEISGILMKEQIMDVLDTLTPREEKVLRLRHGLDGDEEKTLEEIGQMFKLTRERIRQIESKAIRKLRHPSRQKKLRG